MNNNTVIQAFTLLQQLASLCATAGVNETTQTVANEHMQKILNTVVKEEVTKLSAAANGIILDE